jgi:hypothetical protein
MKVRFYPSDIELFHTEDFDLSIRNKPITLTTRTIYDYKDFLDRQELIEFLKSYGIKLDTPNNSLEITKRPRAHIMYGEHTYNVWQGESLLGIMKEFVR